MTEIIIIAALSVVIVALLVTLFIVLNKFKNRLQEAKTMTRMIAFDILRDIDESIDKFNEKYDVQLSLGMSEKGEKRKIYIKFTDPKDENSNEDPQTEQPSEE